VVRSACQTFRYLLSRNKYVTRCSYISLSSLNKSSLKALGFGINSGAPTNPNIGVPPIFTQIKGNLAEETVSVLCGLVDALAAWA
jgi:hypothetical protein